jgi:U1 small nuclear ribonucleoprotein
MKEAFKYGDAKKIDDYRVLVDVERGRTVRNWRPRRLGGGLGNSRAAKPKMAELLAQQQAQQQQQQQSYSGGFRRDDHHHNRDGRKDERRGGYSGGGGNRDRPGLGYKGGGHSGGYSGGGHQRFEGGGGYDRRGGHQRFEGGGGWGNNQRRDEDDRRGMKRPRDNDF